MSGHAAASHRLSPFPHTIIHNNNSKAAVATSTSLQHHSDSRLPQSTSSTSLSAVDMRVPSFPIDPNLGGHQSAPNTPAQGTAATAGLATPPQPPPTFPHTYTTTAASATRPQSSGDPRYSTPTTFQSDYHHSQQHHHPHHHQSQHATPHTDYSGYDTSFGTEDHQTTPITLTTAPATVAGDPESQELRRMAYAALGDTIDVLANRTRTEETGPNGEKARQLFGMSWLMRNCEVSTGATPRNRVYARYVSLCATERLKPLNPASFGKLVRAVFPDIKTRRLGVRGQSKYHYCGIRLRDDDPNARTSDIEDALNPALNSRPSSVLGGFQAPTPPAAVVAPEQDDLSWLMRVKNSPLRFVSFTSAQENSKSASDNFSVPSISPYVTPGMDEDAVNTLSALYITHTVGLIEAIRYVKMKQFLSLISGFYGTLTAPVQRVLINSAIAPWVQKADFAMYKEIVRILSPLALQVVPPTILNSLRSLSTTLPEHVQSTFQNHPPHLLRAKLVPATAFARLLTRLIRVNDTAHAAARFLANPADRELMRSDWLRYVSPKQIVQRELPCGEVLAEQILRDELISLLSPETKVNGQNGDAGRTRETPRKRARTDMVGNSVPPTFSQFENQVEVETSVTTTGDEALPSSDGTSMTQGVLDQWAMWLCELPERFPSVPPRVFLWCMESVGAGALRDITVAGGEGFGAWWVVRCWMDEWMGWIAEKGGFLDMDSDTELTASNILQNNNVRSVEDANTAGEMTALLRDVTY